MRSCGWLAFAALAACGTDDADGGTPAECLENDIVLTCGTGEDAFEPLTDGMTLTMVSGPQGGWHLWVSVEVQNSETNVSILPTITFPRLDDLKISSTPDTFVGLTYDPETCTGSYIGMEARLDPSAIAQDTQQVICQLGGETLHLRVDVTDLEDGRSASCEADVVVAVDPVDEPLCN